MSYDPQKGSLSEHSRPSRFYLTVTPGSEPLANGPCRSILCSEDGVLDLTDLSGTARADVPVQKGYNPLCASVIDEPTTGSAPSVVLALY